MAILASLPGVGRIILATLLAESFYPPGCRRLPCLALPVRHRSGHPPLGQKHDQLTVASPHTSRLRDAVYHWTRVAVQRAPTSRAKYAALRARGHGHARALRSVADRPIAVACAMLENQTPSIPNTRDNAMPRSRYPGHRAAGTIAAKLHLQMVGSPPRFGSCARLRQFGGARSRPGCGWRALAGQGRGLRLAGERAAPRGTMPVEGRRRSFQIPRDGAPLGFRAGRVVLDHFGAGAVSC